jgi:voltage-gated potassium channel
MRARVHSMLTSDAGHAGRQWRIFHLLILSAGLLAVALSSVDGLPPMFDRILTVIVEAVAIVFFAEYVVRLWTAPESARFAGLSDEMARLRWALSGNGLIGLLAVVPIVAVTSGKIHADSDAVPIFCVLWILKLSVHAPAMNTVARVIVNERASLASVLIIFIMVLVTAATLAHLLERHVQPQLFGSIPDALWWAVVTLTTTGYGDVVPITPLGRIVAAFVMICGLGVFGLWTGILATGFAAETRRDNFLKTWESVSKVPFFAALGPAAIADVTHMLRTMDLPARTTIIRKGQTGDCMYFIAAGEVEVDLPGKKVKLGDGAFFGEMALLGNNLRSANITTTRVSKLLVLDLVDFRVLMARHPDLSETIDAEAKRRELENK